MNTVRECGCKGKRSCLICETTYNIQKPTLETNLQSYDAWSYCAECQLIYPGWDTKQTRNSHPRHNDFLGEKFPGVLVKEDFLTAQEGATLIEGLDAIPWCISQSGRRKQNFGPKTNFKKRKLRLGNFNGFPLITQFIQKRFEKIGILRDFQTIEQCSLEYDPLKGASIDPHIDDCWIWGERVVTVNCLGNAVLTMTLFEHDDSSNKYNLHILNNYKDQLIMPLAETKELEKYRKRVIRIPMPNLSLIVLFGSARYQFEHSVLRQDITERRVCIAYREFTPIYINGDCQELGAVVRNKASESSVIKEKCERMAKYK